MKQQSYNTWVTKITTFLQTSLVIAIASLIIEKRVFSFKFEVENVLMYRHNLNEFVLIRLVTLSSIQNWSTQTVELQCITVELQCIMVPSMLTKVDVLHDN